MTGVLCAFAGIGGSGGGGLDTQTVTTGNSGSAPNRLRGYISGTMGSISTGTSAIYNKTITGIYYDEDALQYVLSIPTATNTGWTTMTIGTEVLNRTSATFSSGSWVWATTDTITTQAFGANGNVVSVVFT